MERIIRMDNALMGSVSFEKTLEDEEGVEMNFRGIAIFEEEERNIMVCLHNSWDSPNRIGIAFGDAGKFKDENGAAEINTVDFFSDSIDWTAIPGAIAVINGRMRSLVKMMKHYSIIPENFSITIYNVTLKFHGKEIIVSEIDRGTIAYFRITRKEDKMRFLSTMADRISELWGEFFPGERDYLFFDIKIEEE